ncbi:MAG: PQQ-dependent dehydrogenase, methanol/ethanol family [Ponticaulis sp.]|nr:PQQ-dependent dehydrogenase, methanol/ethanol family [Ponticaulis sp.]
MTKLTAASMAVAIFAFAGCSAGQTQLSNSEQTRLDTPVQAERIANSVDAPRLLNAFDTPEEWLTHGFTYDEQRFSPLHQVNPDTVSQLGVAWTYDLKTNRGVEATPIIVDGVMYVTSSWSVVHALDARTGEELWVYDPEVDRAVGASACCDVVNRGVALWEGKVYVGVIDGRLEALDAATGDLVWSTVTVDQSKDYTITGAPRIVEGRVYIGNGGAEYPVRGYISAYDADTGELDWRFYTTPNPEKAPDGAVSDEAFETVGNVTWGDEGEWKNSGGGGTVWDSIIYDQVNDLLIFGVGNGSPWNRSVRDPSGGDNLFLSSIVAVKPDTGEYVWHFQTTPGDNWDYTATQSLILADIEIEGAERRVVMQAPKNGFFYVLDAATGEFISGNNYVPQNWTSGLDDEGRPIEIAEARYGNEPYLQFPGPLGGHNWHPMAFNPELELVYIPAQEIPLNYQNDLRYMSRPVKWNTGMDFSAATPVEPNQAVFDFLRAGLKGRLLAWDPKTQDVRWSHEHNNAWNGGVLTTGGGLVFQGQLEGRFSAYDAATGDMLWEYDVKSGVASGPGTYELDGDQYVTITTGWGSAYALAAGGFAYDEVVPPMVGRVVTFKLGASGSIPDPDLPEILREPQAEDFGNEETLQTGLIAYARACSVCHGGLAMSSGVLPDLRWSPFTSSEAAWRSVVLEGSLRSQGMVSFADVLSEDEAEAIRAYVVKQAHIGTQLKQK